MKLKFLGVRGSRPTHKRSLLGYGGNSTSLEFCVDDNFYIFLDGGSGLVRRGTELTEESPHHRYHFLITHTHWDHILGFPLFQPFYNANNEVFFYASNTSRANFTDLFLGLQRESNIPVPMAELRAQMRFKTIFPGSPFTIENKVSVNTLQLNHQGITLGYRLESGRSSVCVITDNAPIGGGNYLGEGMVEAAKGREAQFDESLVQFLKGAHTVVFDTHFTEDNLKKDLGAFHPPTGFKVL